MLYLKIYNEKSRVREYVNRKNYEEIYAQIEKELGKYSRVENTEQYAKEYIEYRLEHGVSVWTAKMERSALGKLYNKTIEMEMPVRNQSDVTRSRNDCEHDKHFSVKNHSSEILVASATETRREDLCKIAIKDFEEYNNHLYVRITGSKGGRNRLAPVLPSKEQDFPFSLQIR